MRPAAPIDPTAKLRFFLQVLAFALAIAAVQYAFQPERPYEIPMRYSLSISICTWALIDFGRHFVPSAAETGWPTGKAGLALPFFGIVLGYLAGTLLADWWCGWPWQSFAPESRGQLRISVTLSALAGTAITYFFYSRSQTQYLEARAQTATEQAHEARLKLLESQLEPHMLFNTLANLRVLIGSDAARAQTMLDHLIAYLRATLSASRADIGAHTLEQEFERLRDYLELMKVRMGARLSYTLDLPEALKQHSVPPLLLQPLVENSIQHGLEPKVAGGSISVRAHATADARLEIEVLDTGLGLPGSGSSRAGSGFGLRQVRERLSTLYGSQGAMLLEAADAGGTRASITFPLKK